MSDEADAVSGETYQGSHERNIAAIRAQAAAVKQNAVSVIGECNWCLRNPVPGPSGALLYRLAVLVRDRWQAKKSVERNDFATFSSQVFGIIDWLPARATAITFAIVGDFEDALYCWRTQAGQWPDHNLGIVLASGAGALGVQLGLPLADGIEVSEGAELGLGDPADVDFMQSAVGLVWRATVFWALLLFLLGLASLAG